MSKYEIDVQGVGIVEVEAETFEKAKEMMDKGLVGSIKIPYRRFVSEKYSFKCIDKEQPRKIIRFHKKSHRWYCPTCYQKAFLIEGRCYFCGQKLINPNYVKRRM